MICEEKQPFAKSNRKTNKLYQQPNARFSFIVLVVSPIN